ncbi:MAG: winged helix DNA-binding domain-containing protein [Gemmatimonadales bacterium]
MKPSDIVKRRLAGQHLIKPTLRTATEVVSMLGAVQAQDYTGAKWALAQRTVDATDETIEQEIASGAIVRTHILRPTWHFVAAADIRWMLELSAPRVNVMCGYMYREMELDDAVFRKSRAALIKALEGGKQLTRVELARVLGRARISVEDPVRVAHLMIRAELDGIVCSGARRGKQFTYGLLEERAPQARSLDRDEALAELTKRYFSTRGPATIDDFCWWSGLTKADAKRGVQAAAGELEHTTSEDRACYFAPMRLPAQPATPIAHLLPNYDEYFIGLKDRNAMLNRLTTAGIDPKIDALSGHILTINGQVVGRWRRTLTKKEAIVSLHLLTSPTQAERRTIEKSTRRFGRFLGLVARAAA